MVTPASSAALKLARLRWMPCGSCCSPLRHPAYWLVGSPAAGGRASAAPLFPTNLKTPRAPPPPRARGLPAIAVLDGFGAGEDRAPHALGRAAVHRHRHAGAARGLDGELHFFQRK